MKILYFSPHPELRIEAQTGYGTHMREMIRAFEALGHEVVYYIGGQCGAKTPQLLSSESQRHLTQKPTGWLKRIAKGLFPSVVWETLRDLSLLLKDKHLEGELVQIIQTFQPDVIYERSHYGMVSGLRVALSRSIHHVLEVNCPNVTERIHLSGPSFLNAKAEKRDRWKHEHSNHVLAVSLQLARDLEICQSSPNWSITPNAIRIGQEKESSLSLKRESLNIEPETIVIGFVGAIFSWHGVDLIIKAIAQLQKAGIPAQAIIVGDGEIRQELELLAENLNVFSSIHFIGSVAHRDTFSFTRICDILVLPKSHSYGSPVKLFEYGLARKCCIAPNTVPVTEVFRHHEHGLIVEPNLEDFTSAIRYLFENPSLRETFQNRWYEKVLASHTWNQNAKIALSQFLASP